MSAQPSTDRALWGIVAEFGSPDDLTRAAARVRDAGYVRWDAYTPFPVHGLDDAMGVRPTRLPWIVLGAGITGCLGGILMQWWMNAVDYPIIISGKPFFSLPANIPVAFELTILLSATTAFLGMLVMNALPQFRHPLFANERFRKVTTDAFFIAIEAADPRFDAEETERLLRGAGGTRVERVED
jgi:hypothetical protein